MKKHFRLLTTVLCLLMALSMCFSLVACGGSGSQETEKNTESHQHETEPQKGTETEKGTETDKETDKETGSEKETGSGTLPGDETYLGMFTGAASYTLSDDYTLTASDCYHTGSADSVKLKKITSFDLGGHTLDLGGKTLEIRSEENGTVVFTNGTIKNGQLTVIVPKGDITFDGVVIDKTATYTLEAAPSTIRMMNASIGGKGVITSNSHVEMSYSTVAEITLDGSASLSAGTGVSMESITLSPNASGAKVELGEGSVVDTLDIQAPVAVEVKGQVSSLTVNESVKDDTKNDMVINIAATATVDTVQLDAGASVEIEGKVSALTVDDKAANDQTAVSVNVKAKASVAKVEVKAQATVAVSGTVSSVKVAETAKSVQVEVKEEAKVAEVKVSGEAAVKVEGSVSNIQVEEKAQNTSVTVAEKATVTNVLVSAENTKVDVQSTTKAPTVYVEEKVAATTTVEGTKAEVATDEIIKEIQAHSHLYLIDSRKEATCTENGVIVYKCECGETMEEIIASAGHNFLTYTVIEAPTATKEGKAEYTCAKCGEKVIRTISPSGEIEAPEISGLFGGLKDGTYQVTNLSTVKNELLLSGGITHVVLDSLIGTVVVKDGKISAQLRASATVTESYPGSDNTTVKAVGYATYENQMIKVYAVTDSETVRIQPSEAVITFMTEAIDGAEPAAETETEHSENYAYIAVSTGLGLVGNNTKAELAIILKQLMGMLEQEGAMVNPDIRELVLNSELTANILKFFATSEKNADGSEKLTMKPMKEINKTVSESTCSELLSQFIDYNEVKTFASGLMNTTVSIALIRVKNLCTKYGISYDDLMNLICDQFGFEFGEFNSKYGMMKIKDALADMMGSDAKEIEASYNEQVGGIIKMLETCTLFDLVYGEDADAIKGQLNETVDQYSDDVKAYAIIKDGHVESFVFEAEVEEATEEGTIGGKIIIHYNREDKIPTIVVNRANEDVFVIEKADQGFTYLFVPTEGMEITGIIELTDGHFKLTATLGNGEFADSTLEVVADKTGDDHATMSIAVANITAANIRFTKLNLALDFVYTETVKVDEESIKQVALIETMFHEHDLIIRDDYYIKHMYELDGSCYYEFCRGSNKARVNCVNGYPEMAVYMALDCQDSYEVGMTGYSVEGYNISTRFYLDAKTLKASEDTFHDYKLEVEFTNGIDCEEGGTYSRVCSKCGDSSNGTFWCHEETWTELDPKTIETPCGAAEIHEYFVRCTFCGKESHKTEFKSLLEPHDIYQHSYEVLSDAYLNLHYGTVIKEIMEEYECSREKAIEYLKDDRFIMADELSEIMPKDVLSAEVYYANLESYKCMRCGLTVYGMSGFYSNTDPNQDCKTFDVEWVDYKGQLNQVTGQMDYLPVSISLTANESVGHCSSAQEVENPDKELALKLYASLYDYFPLKLDVLSASCSVCEQCGKSIGGYEEVYYMTESGTKFGVYFNYRSNGQLAGAYEYSEINIEDSNTIMAIAEHYHISIGEAKKVNVYYRQGGVYVHCTYENGDDLTFRAQCEIGEGQGRLSNTRSAFYDYSECTVVEKSSNYENGQLVGQKMDQTSRHDQENVQEYIASENCSELGITVIEMQGVCRVCGYSEGDGPVNQYVTYHHGICRPIQSENEFMIIEGTMCQECHSILNLSIQLKDDMTLYSDWVLKGEGIFVDFNGHKVNLNGHTWLMYSYNGESIYLTDYDYDSSSWENNTVVSGDGLLMMATSYGYIEIDSIDFDCEYVMDDTVDLKGLYLQYYLSNPDKYDFMADWFNIDSIEYDKDNRITALASADYSFDYDEKMDAFVSNNQGIDNSIAQMILAVKLEAGQVLLFRYSVSSESGCDRVEIDNMSEGENLVIDSGDSDGSVKVYAETSGTYLVSVSYYKDGSVDCGSDSVIISGITIK